MIGYQGQSSKPRITYPHPQVEPFNSTPLIEILDIPQRPQFYTAKEFEEEKRKLWALHVELNVQYEDKIKNTIKYLIDKIAWPTFYEQLSKLMDIWKELKNNEVTLKPIVNKWNNRDRDATL